MYLFQLGKIFESSNYFKVISVFKCTNFIPYFEIQT